MTTATTINLASAYHYGTQEGTSLSMTGDYGDVAAILPPDNSSRRPQILLADRDGSILHALSLALAETHETWDLHFTRNPDDALRKALSQDFDTIVLDIQMVRRNYNSILRQLRACNRTKDVPIIILTEKRDTELRRHVVDQAVFDVLTRPVEPFEVLARIRSGIRLKFQRDNVARQQNFINQMDADFAKTLEYSRLESVSQLLKAGEFRDETAGMHSTRVGCYSKAIAEAMGMPRDFVDHIFLTSPLHDIGKIGIPDSILRKDGNLTYAEESIMQTHCIIGARLLWEESKLQTLVSSSNQSGKSTEVVRSPLWNMAANIALMHHEHWNGSGYPSCLVGEDIPIEAAIVAIADSYDKLRSSRPYKFAHTETKALEILKYNVNRRFSPDVHRGFETALSTIREVEAELAGWAPSFGSAGTSKDRLRRAASALEGKRVIRGVTKKAA